jgi:hypothetical protein
MGTGPGFGINGELLARLTLLRVSHIGALHFYTRCRMPDPTIWQLVRIFEESLRTLCIGGPGWIPEIPEPLDHLRLYEFVWQNHFSIYSESIKSLLRSSIGHLRIVHMIGKGSVIRRILEPHFQHLHSLSYAPMGRSWISEEPIWTLCPNLRELIIKPVSDRSSWPIDNSTVSLIPRGIQHLAARDFWPPLVDLEPSGEGADVASIIERFPNLRALTFLGRNPSATLREECNNRSIQLRMRATVSGINWRRRRISSSQMNRDSVPLWCITCRIHFPATYRFRGCEGPGMSNFGPSSVSA